MQSRVVRFALAIVAVAAGCGTAPATPPSSATDATSAHDAAPETGAADAVPGGDASIEAGSPAPWNPPPVAPADTGTEVAATGWLVAQVNPNADQVYAALDNGSFALPDVGTKAYGVGWAGVQPKNGQLPPQGNASLVVYAARTVTAAAPMGAVLQLDRAYDAWLNGRRLAGDVYGHGWMRFPGQLNAGDNLLVVRGRGGQQWGVRVETSSHKAKLNPHDLTRPDLRVGDGAARWLGVPLLVFGQPAADAALDISARVVADDHWQATHTITPGLSGASATQLPFELIAKAAPVKVGEVWPVTLRVDSPSWPHSYELKIELPTVATDVCYRQTFRSPDDGSVQYYGVRPPVDQGPNQPLVLSVHGAGVDAIGQAQAYHAHPKTWIAAPTNRRPFGFDWEEWGHWNALYALEDAAQRFKTSPAHQYLTGHSMGGHGTWQLGVHHSDRFAVLGPSAGWGSFYTYTGLKKPTGPFARARAHSDTHVYMSNLASRAAYVIHGTADDNVPWSEGKAMFEAVSKVSTDVYNHWEPGAGHWWDGDKSPGADCVDWPPLFELMGKRQLDPVPLAFEWRSPAPWYAENHAWLKLGSAKSPNGDCIVSVKPKDAKALSIVTTNVRSMVLDGKALRSKGIETVTVDGADHAVPDGPLQVGPETGKRPGSSGPYNQAYHKPFLFVYPDGDEAMAAVAGWMLQSWMAIGNGHGAALPLGKVTAQVRKNYQLIHFGVPSAQVPLPAAFPFTWSAQGVQVEGVDYGDKLLLTVYDGGPDTPGLGAALRAPKAKPWLLYRFVPFSSRSGLPDYVLYDEGGVIATGFFGPDWQFDPKLGVGW
ncbi:MAG: prolyl oligopeptidase family serine peptidase [Deltaproteobacteria bacterium]|nr:prolyl oligopeptidase family serine peptidase [Deltaproteobacteria bacterium]